MSIPESQLNTWSHQGSITQSAMTFQTIQTALEDPSAPFSNRNFDIFLQGSYGNHTNIYADSDVDLVICLTSTFYSNTDSLSDFDKTRYKEGAIPESYGYKQFKADVLKWLRYKFGSNVQSGNKAIKIPGNNARRDADVLVCAEHRNYHSDQRASLDDYDSGIVFWTREGKEIVNYPKQHRDNSTFKHKQALNRFKPNVRVLKNIRNAMIDRQLISNGQAPSYFLEGMLSNVPNTEFGNSYTQTFLNSLVWLNQCDPSQLTCVNGMHYLIRDQFDTCWNTADFNRTRVAMWNLWEQWHSTNSRAI